MADEDAAGLPYGHFGRPFYDIRDSSWRFPRVLTDSTVYKPVAPPERSASLDHAAQHDVEQNPSLNPATRIGRDVTQLATTYPEIWPAQNLIKAELRVSEAVIQAAECNDSDRRNLLVFARLRSAITHNQIHVAACAHGIDGSVLRLSKIRLRRAALDDVKSLDLVVPTLDVDGVFWPFNAGPILQMVFSDCAYPKCPLLAVRLYHKTVVFRVYSRTDANQSHVSSDLGLDIIHVITNAHLAGSMIVDVALMSGWAGKLAVIDRDGRSKVFPVTSQTSVLAETRLQSSTSSVLPSQAGVEHGWHRLAWLRSGDVLAICSRNSINFHLLDDILVLSRIASYTLDPSESTTRLLDVTTLTNHPNHFLILTGTCIILLEVVALANTNYKIVERLRVRHFRDSLDMSLHMYAREHNSDVYVNLTSRSTTVLVSYRMHVAINEMVSFKGTARFDCIDMFARANPKQTYMVNHFLFPTEKRYTKQSRRETRQQMLDVHISADYLALLALGSDYSITECLFSPETNDIAARVKLRPITQKSNTRINDDFREIDDFVVSDHECDAELHLHEPIARLARRVRRSTSLPNRLQDFQHIVRILEDQSQVEKLDVVLQEVRGLLEEPASEHQQSMCLLNQLAETELWTDNIDGISADFSRLMLANSDQKDQLSSLAVEELDEPRQILQRVPLPQSSLSKSELGSQDLSSIQKLIVAMWITPLNADIPARVRIAKAQLSQRIAIELFMALHMIRAAHYETTQMTGPSTQSNAEDSGWLVNLPVRPLHDSQSSEVDRIEPRPTEPLSVLPTPSPTGTPSITTTSSRTTHLGAPHLERLSRYTTLNPPTSSSSTPRAVDRILAHWPVGDDPRTYDWLAVTKRLSRRAEAAEQAEELTERERRRLQRAADRHLRRQRKEAAASQSLQLASSQAPEILSASQPPVRLRPRSRVDASSRGRDPLVGSSQSAFDPVVGAASQTLPGRFGGRPPLKKKKRKSGF